MPPGHPWVETFEDSGALADGGALHFVSAAAEAIAARGRFVVALSGGSTPRALHARLASPSLVKRVDWARVHLLWGDERCVPPDSEQSNYRMARETLIDHVAIPAENVHRIRGEDDPARAATQYEQLLRDLLSSDVSAGVVPGIDLIMLGLGGEGHVASLFPGSPALHERARWVLAQRVPVDPPWRVTLTPAIINAACEVAFLVAGAEKAAIVHRVMEGTVQPDLLPAQVVAPTNGRLTWFLDAAAAAQLNGV